MRLSAEALVRKYGPDQLRQVVASMGLDDLAALEYDWSFWARDKQLPPPGEWKIWLLLAGRGWGKSKVGSETVRIEATRNPKARIALVGATAADIRDVMVEGPSGILNAFPPHQRPHYESSKRKITFHSGAVAHCYSADEPERLRGPNFSFAWADELAAWVKEQETWDQLMMTMRAGSHPRIVVTTTPKPSPLIVSLTKRPDIAITSGSTFENSANLAPSYLADLRRTFGGTRLGRQEIDAEILLDVPGALFQAADIEKARVQEAPPLDRIVVAVDPAPTSASGSDLTGICVAGRKDDQVYILEDLSLRDTPDNWARVAVQAYYRHKADSIVVERNRGGDMVKALIQSVDNNVPVKEVTAMRGKHSRAEPVAALYEQGRVHHVGYIQRLEKQMTVFAGIAGRRDDRVDANLWSIHDLIIAESPFFFV